MMTPEASSAWGKVGGRIVPKNVEDLFWLHVMVVNKRWTVPADEWRDALNVIVKALGWPAGDDTRQAVADMIHTEASTGAVSVAS